MTRLRAFAPTEILAVIGIALILCVAMTPVLHLAKDKFNQRGCASNLRQIYLQTELYAAEYDPSLTGTSIPMGLPPEPQINYLPALATLRCPNSPSPSTPILGVYYYHYYSRPSRDGHVPTWKDYTTKYGDAAVMYADPFHNDPNVSLESGNHITRHISGITIGGQLVQRYAKGDWMVRTWWNK